MPVSESKNTGSLISDSENSSLSGFHPVIQDWFSDRFKKPTAVQERGWQAIRKGTHTLISAPTGSGKTLTAFLNVVDELFREGIENGGSLPDETRVLYVSPLKALSADIHHNLSEPRQQIQKLAKEKGIQAPKITAAVRSGDTSSYERQSMVKTPPNILITTPESLYLLLTAERSREILRTVKTVIVDEIHAILESRRGSHLALSLERLQHITEHHLQRIGLSATQKPIEEVADYLIGNRKSEECKIVDEGHYRELDLALEMPDSPLEAVLSGEVREEIYDRIADLINSHTTTLIFVNTRREAERATHHLSELLDKDAVTAHHGSLSKEKRLDAEQRLKDGSLKALVATASMELGIDIGHVDLVCQLGSPRRIATFLQRVGRSGHTVYGTPKGRLFPLTRSELVESAALLRSVQRGDLDRIQMLDAPLDILAQQIVAEVACEEWEEENLYQLFNQAYPYRNLNRKTYEEVIRMVSHGFTSQNGNRRGALIHYDAVNKKLRRRRGSRLKAITSGGAIPDNADYRVVMEPGDTFVGTVDEDFAIESLPGDIFQLGSTSWQILRIETGVVRVQDARGEPPTIPFWFGEAPARSNELSQAVSELRKKINEILEAKSNGQHAADWLMSELELPEAAADQIVEYLGETKRMLGTIPTQQTLVLERFFDEAGGMQLILHAPFGNRVNKAWGLALRKRFCRQFNFELQAAATEEGVLLSLGPQHSFPLDDVFRYLHPETVEDVLVQALLDAPMFQTHWRWNASLSLALLRWRGGHKVAPQIQRMQAEDLLVSVFPDAAACLENIAGDREIPDHPLVNQTIQDCLTDVMDIEGLKTVLRQIHEGELNLVARDLPEPSPLSNELLTARPYAFLDDAPLEERRAHAVHSRRAFEPSSSDDLGKLDKEAIDKVRNEIWPDPENSDELHDALLTFGFLKEQEIKEHNWNQYFEKLEEQNRATRIIHDGLQVICTTAERLPELQIIYPEAQIQPKIDPPENAEHPEDRSEAVKQILQSRMALSGPTTVAALVSDFGIPENEINQGLIALENDGTILRGQFTPGNNEQEWCDRRLLSRIHRYTLNRLRAEIQPVSSADLMRFLMRWQRLEPGHRIAGEEGLMSIIEQLEGFDLPASAWEADVLTARCDDYSTEYLDNLCSSGRVMWGRITPPSGNGNGLQNTGILRSSPISLWQRENDQTWLKNTVRIEDQDLSSYAEKVLEVLQNRGASFFHDLVSRSNLLPSHVEQALGELVALGIVTSDSFSGLRALLTPEDKRNSHYGRQHKRRGKTAPYGVDTAGRWSLLHKQEETNNPGISDEQVELKARILLRRYGVVFRKLLTRETSIPPWRDLLRIYWRLEARGEIRGGHFVKGFSGEQFALPEAVGLLRKMRKEPKSEELITLSAADPLNLTGIITPGNRIPAITTNRVGYRDGIPVVAIEGGQTRNLENGESVSHDVEKALKLRKVPPELRAFIK